MSRLYSMQEKPCILMPFRKAKSFQACTRNSSSRRWIDITVSRKLIAITSRPHLLPTSTVRKQPCCIGRNPSVAVHVERYECFAAVALIGNSDKEAKVLQPNTTSTRDISLRHAGLAATSRRVSRRVLGCRYTASVDRFHTNAHDTVTCDPTDDVVCAAGGVRCGLW